MVEISMTDRKILSIGEKKYLDIFRICAALFVVFGHAFHFMGLTVFKDETYFAPIQNIGVVMLFMLSGFLTAYSLEKKNEGKDYSLGKFTLHKTVRIMCEYIPALIMIALIDFVSIKFNPNNYTYYNAYSLSGFMGNAVMLQCTNFSKIQHFFCFDPFGSARQLWTLSFEWWFYFIYAIIYLAIANKRKFSVKDMILLAIVFFLPAECIIGGRGGGLGIVFAMGVLAYFFYKRLAPRFALVLFPVSLCAFIVFELYSKDAYNIFSFALMFIVFIGGLEFSANICSDKQSGIIRFIARSTFMLYLIHYSIMDILCKNHLVSGYIGLMIIICLSIGASLLFYYIFGDKIGKILSEKVESNHV